MMNRLLPDDAAAMPARYARRQNDRHRYSQLLPANLYAVQERQRALSRVFRSLPFSVQDARVVEVGCGGGTNLAELLLFGFRAPHLTGIELLPESAERARAELPSAVTILTGDATYADIPIGSQDIVYQSTVFSSLLTDEAQHALADRMWRWRRPGGGILWYDFLYNNPRNPDVRGVPLMRVRALFPEGRFSVQRVTLGPPIARAVPWAYSMLNLCPWFRTHALVWITK